MNAAMFLGVDVSWVAVMKAYTVDVSCKKLPFSNQYSDIFYMGDVIEHLINPYFAVDEMIRVIKTGGYAVLSTSNLASWLNKVLLVFGMQPLFSEVSTIRQFGRFEGQTTFLQII